MLNQNCFNSLASAPLLSGTTEISFLTQSEIQLTRFMNLRLLKELGTNRLKNENIEIKISYPKTFDTGLFGVEYPELYAKYTYEIISMDEENINLSYFL